MHNLQDWKERVSFFRTDQHLPILAQIAVLRQSTTIFPIDTDIFRIFSACPLENVRVVILGQDPYHGAGQAHGLSFSVPDGIKPPPSLRNIFKEITNDIYEGQKQNFSPNLTRWVEQGVFLLNASLTVEEGKAGSHKNLGWQTLTDEVISTISTHQEHVVFILWGAFAQKKRVFIDTTKHLILEAVHPSPLSAHGGFFGSKPFSQTNRYLQEHGYAPIIW